MPEARVTTAEAAFVLREPVEAVKKALSVGPVRPMIVKSKGRTVRAIGRRDMFYLYAVRALREELTPKTRVQFYDAIHQMRTVHAEEIQFDRIRLEVGDLFREVESRTAELAALSDKVAFRSDGEALIKGTDIEVHRVAALIDGGLSIDDVIEDYPSLTRDQVETAKAYAAAHPKRGRPYPSMTAKRALRGAGLEALDKAPAAAIDAAGERAARAFLREIGRRYSVAAAFLYGSRMRGDFRPDSDADVAVILKGRRGDRAAVARDMAAAAFHVMMETGVMVEALPLWQDEFDHPEMFANPRLIGTIRREGVRL